MSATITILSILSYALIAALNLLALFVVPKNRKPSSGTAWLLVIFLVPFLGWLLFLLIGRNKLPKPRRDAQKKVDDTLDRVLRQLQTNRQANKFLDGQVPAKYQAVAKLATALGHLPVFSSNQLRALNDYDQALQSIASDISRAKKSVYVGYYIFTLDQATEPIVAELAAAARRGVTVRVLFDAFGSRKFKGTKLLKQRFANDNIPYRVMLPLRLFGKNYLRPDLRNHRKVVTIDQSIGYTGSQNLVARGYHRKDEIVYDELVVRMTGPIVYQLSAVFAADWWAETKQGLKDIAPESISNKVDDRAGSLLQLLPSGPGYEDENNLKVFTQLVHTAQASITIVNPYFVPPEPLLMAIVSAARRGVKVVMVNSEASDQWMVAHAQRSYYETLLKAGVNIKLYKKPTLLHSKYMIIDEEVVVVGSSNMDVRSFELNHELSLLCYDKAFTSKMVKQTKQYLDRCSSLTLSGWQKRRPIAQLLDNIARLASTLQ